MKPFVLLALLPLAVLAADPSKKNVYPPQPWASWVEPDFPFFSSILDARREGLGANNLTPRGIILKLDHDCWVCFDTDLLRISAIWRGKGVTDKALAPGSYLDAGRKTPGGQFPAPQPDGRLWLGNGLFPGWQSGDKISKEDPREPAPSIEEVGRGPVPESIGRFQNVRLVEEGVVLEYDAQGSRVREWWQASLQDNGPVVERHISVSASKNPLLLVAGIRMNGPSQEVEAGVTVTGDAELAAHEDLWVVRVPAREKAATFCVTFCEERKAPAVSPRAVPEQAPGLRWPQEAVSVIRPSASKKAYVLDHVDLPDDNPWKRAVRLGDIQFLKDGTGVVVTVDGDVWLVRGLAEMNGPVKWRRFTSGLHEPMTCAIRDEQIFVFDRNGIWRLRDSNNDGEADVHELFSNAFAQTSDMREFPSTLRLAPGGAFVIAKGGQEATTIGKHNGSVLRISADGRKSEVLGYGFRQPSIGVNLRTGLVTSSDQEGQYIPSTPLHIVRDHQFHGFLSDKLPKEQYPAPIAEPLTWMPHAVNSSAMSQVWLFDAKMGPLNDQMVQICFNKPELLRVILNERGSRPQASVVSITDEFDFPPLNGSVNPVDGRLYLAGFQVIGWGNTLDTLAGLCRVRYTGAPSLLPREIVPMDQGVLLRFDVALDPKKAADPAAYSLGSWGYKRAHTYGSAQYKADGGTGVDWLTPSSAYVSRDGRAVFVGVPGMKPVMQLRIGWSIASADGASMAENAYTTPYELTSFDPKAEGFGDIQVDLTPRAAAAQAKGPVSAEEGLRLSQMLGCVACHSVKDQDLFKIGPKWNKLFGAKRDYVDEKKKKGSVVVDDNYLRESILQPSAKRHADFVKSEYAMPSYAGVVTESQLESLILYIKSLE